MRESESRKNEPGQDWHKADARVLGQILAAQNILFALPDTTRIAEFYAQTLISIPGITACRVCLGGRSVQAGEMENSICAECDTSRNLPGEDDALVPAGSILRCSLADQPDLRVIAIESSLHHFGYLVFKIQQAAVGEVYQPFISNLSNYVALILENRRQKDLLQKAHDELERKVEERTRDSQETARRLEQSRNMLQMIIESIPVRVFWKDRDLAYLGGNTLFASDAGYSRPDQLLGKDDFDMGWREQAERYRADDRQVMELGLPKMNIIEPQTTPGGARIWLKTSKVPLCLAEGEVFGVLGVYEDITERKRAEDTMQARLRLLEFAGSHSMDELLTATLDEIEALTGSTIGFYHFVESDQKTLSLQNWSTNTLKTMCTAAGKGSHYDISRAGVWVDCVHERRPVIHNDYASLPHRKGFPEGHAPVLREAVVPIFRGGQIRAIIGIGNKPADYDEGDLQILSQLGDLSLDIAERKRAEEALHQASETLRAMLDAAPVGIFDLDTEGRVKSIWNPTAEQMLGWRRNEVLGRYLPSVPEEGKEEFAHFRQWVRSGKAIIGKDVVRRRKDGSLIEYSLYAAPEYDDDGKVVGNIAVIVDITERKRAEVELKEYRDHLEDLVMQRTDELAMAKEHAEAANQAKSAFLANMSHELRSPLNIVLGFTQLMERDPSLSRANRETLSMIGRSGEHLLTLINDVLEMSRIEAGHSALRKQGFDLHRALLGIEEMKHSRAAGKGLQLTVQVASDVPRFISTDEAKLRQVLLNLIGNAIKFTTEGGVTLRVSNAAGHGREREAGPSTVRLLFEVEDTGMGIAPEQARTIFDPFVQAREGQPVKEGTGLGLAISRRYVRLMGGDVRVESVLHKGSIFRFDIHADLVGAADVLETEQSVHKVIGLAPGSPPYRILVVEDMEESRLLLRKLIESVGFEVREAVNGQEGIEEFERWKPHLICMDMRMPVMDGYEATRRIKATDRDERAKIICISASSFEEQKELALSHGCDDFVRKPFREADIFDAISRHLGVRYVYDVEAGPPSRDVRGKAKQAPVTPGDLAALPSDLLESLERAAESLKVNDVQDVIEQVRQVDRNTGDRLTDLARDFRYDLILAGIRQARLQSGERS